VPNFTPTGAKCRPCGGEKPQNRPLTLSNLNNRRFALRAMLPANRPNQVLCNLNYFISCVFVYFPFLCICFYRATQLC